MGHSGGQVVSRFHPKPGATSEGEITTLCSKGNHVGTDPDFECGGTVRMGNRAAAPCACKCHEAKPVVVFGPIETVKTHINTDPDRESLGQGRSEFRGRHPYPGLVMAGRYSSTTRRRCSACGELVRGSSMKRHVRAKHPGVGIRIYSTDDAGNLRMV